jgi:hypothetical protein
MSAWRHRALEAFPEQRRLVEAPETTLHQLFFELLPWCRQAHKSNDVAALKRIYDFAHWCSIQPEKELWNPAGVSFYEHLADARITLEAMPRWVPRGTFDDVAGLLEARLGSAEVDRIRKLYDTASRRSV